MFWRHVKVYDVDGHLNVSILFLLLLHNLINITNYVNHDSGIKYYTCIYHYVTTAGPNDIVFLLFFIKILNTSFYNMLKINLDINQQDFKIVDLHFVKSEYFSIALSCESRQRDTTSSG